ncbi:MAG TPA: HAD-IB family phosphatase [Candidatus Thermoplasmatota archaeon]|nr:HAD-IB family phosphatase [Candidatus Thermoplasmatota archaeon]
MAPKLVSLDLDGTLIHPAIFNAVAEPLGFGDKLAETTRLYFEGKMTADETFHADYKNFVGRRVDEMLDALRASDAWTPGIREGVAALHDAGMRVAVTTDQPEFLVQIVRELFGVDHLVCTPAEVRNGRVAGGYDLQHDKWANLARTLAALKIDPREAAHVGNGSNDVPVFRRVGYSIAVNPMNEGVRSGAVDVVEKLEDLSQLTELLLGRRP